MHQTFKLPYGKGVVDLRLDSSLYDVTSILPADIPPLKNPEKIFTQKSKTPLGSPALSELVQKKHSDSLNVIIVTSDHTRPVPNNLLIPWIVDELDVNDSCIRILIGTGTHRSPTNKELLSMLGPEITKRFEIIIHNCLNHDNLVSVGKSQCGSACLLHHRYVEADVKIAIGFIEPHFFTGFSGGSKAIVPGIAGMGTISHLHRASLIADPCATWGCILDNPVLDLSREMTSLCPPDCIVNVTMNPNKQITGIFIGDYIKAHNAGCQVAQNSAITRVHQKFPAVVTTNSGYPLDMNFYQTVKGISAAANCVQEDGVIIVVSECKNGIPDNSDFNKMLSQDRSSDDLLVEIMNRSTTPLDQWQVQVFLQILQKHKVYLYSSMDKENTKTTRVIHISDIEKTLKEIRSSFDIKQLPIAIMPYGPLTIPIK